MPRLWKVGELAERCGLTVRTLHHYDAAGLLRPSGRTGSAHGSGHRLYGPEDVARLQQILSLKALGFSLEQIREALSREDYEPRRVVRLHLDRVRGQLVELKALEARLAALSDALDRPESVSADDFLATIEGMTMFEKYYTPEQAEYLEKRREQVGPEAIEDGQRQWALLMDEVRAAMDEGVDPASPRAAGYARRWLDLIAGFTGGDPGVFQSLQKMYENEDHVRGMDVAGMRPMMDWMGKAMEAAGVRHPGM